MDSLPVEIIELIFMFVNPKDYTNFILSYDVALLLWKSETSEKYKQQYLRVVREDFVIGSGIYAIKTIRVDNGEKHGKCTEYHENGQIRINKTYQNGQLHGKYVKYYENGQICEDIIYQIICDISQIHGKYISYYKNGQIWEDTTYQNSQIHGKYIRYYENSQVCEDTTYKNGKKQIDITH
jgi:hypothetical protein